MKFSYSAVWDDTAALIRANAPLILALVGVFVFFPTLLVSYLLPPPPIAPADPLRAVVEFYHANWYWLLLEGLVVMVGSLAILKLILARGGTSVGGAIAGGFALLPFYFLASLFAGVMIGVGAFLFLLPGLYLFGRLAPLPAVLVAEGRRNPVDALQRTFALTKGNGWAIFGLVLLVAIPGLVVTTVIDWLLGIVLITVAGKALGLLLGTIVASATSAALATLLIVLYAALYRRLTAPA
jgi:hypothetical protein